jgi:hypothetical protein
VGERRNGAAHPILVMRCPSAAFLQRGFELLRELHQRMPEDSADFPQFQDVELPFAALVLRDERLGLALSSSIRWSLDHSADRSNAVSECARMVLTQV